MRALARLRRVGAFMAAGPPSEWSRLAVLGWARDNPSSSVATRGVVSVKPNALHGARLTIDPSDLGQLISFEEVFVERAYDLQLVPFTPALIIDCGAHAGFFSTLAASRFKGVPLVAFEPNPANLPILRENLSNAPAATVFDAAVSTSMGTARFSAAVSNGGRIVAGNDGVEVRMIDLRQQLPPQGTPLLLKMDIEGEEMRLLPHVITALPRRCAVFLETHDGTASRQQLATALSTAGFSVTTLRERGQFADLFAVRSAA